MNRRVMNAKKKPRTTVMNLTKRMAGEEYRNMVSYTAFVDQSMSSKSFLNQQLANDENKTYPSKETLTEGGFGIQSGKSM